VWHDLGEPTLTNFQIPGKLSTCISQFTWPVGMTGNKGVLTLYRDRDNLLNTEILMVSCAQNFAG